MTALRIIPARMADILEQADLLAAHREELATDKEAMVLNPDAATYLALEATGDTIVLVALDMSGKIVGYSVNLIRPSLHYADLLVCTNDVIYLDPAYRGAKEGIALVMATENAARERSQPGRPMYMAWHAKPGTPLEQLLKSTGHHVQDVVYTRRVV